MYRRIKWVNRSDQTYVSTLLISLRIRGIAYTRGTYRLRFSEAKYNARKKGKIKYGP
jgi:hypothetical protein